MDTATTQLHRLEMTDRSEMKVFGVIDVHSFNDEGILLETNQGTLLVGGENLRITKLNLEQGEVNLKGEINDLSYSNSSPISNKAQGFFSRLLK